MEPEERARRIEAIQAQIRQWDAKLTQVKSQISALTKEQSNLNSYLGDWDTQKGIYNGSELLSDVVIINVFEGVCADKIKMEMGESIKEMDQTCSRVRGLNGNVGVQIARLNQYVSVINSRLTMLRGELNSL